VRIVVHDYGGHAFPVQLSRCLASRGHQVLHLYSGSILVPQGSWSKSETDPENFDVKPLFLNKQIKKESLITRRAQEIDHGKLVLNEIRTFKPDVFIAATTALDTQRLLQAACDKFGIPTVFWLQDVVGLATMSILKKRVPILGWLAGKHYIAMEQKLLHSSHSIIAITSDFKDLLVSWGFDASKVEVIENWAPLGDVPVRPKINSWSEDHGFSQTFNFLYSGTIGKKHNPELLVLLAKAFETEPSVRVVIVSQGPGRKWLEQQVKEEGLSNLHLLNYQPFESVPDVLGAADVVVALLEADAGTFSVPSKVMTYMCSGKPMLLAVPPENLASRVVSENQTGLTSPPKDIDAFIKNARSLFESSELRTRLGENSRSYAERNFDIEKITDRFETVLTKVVKSASKRG